MSHIIDNLKRELEGTEREIKAKEIGQVVEVGDGIARISGLANVALQEMLEFETSTGVVEGVAFNLEHDSVGAIVLGNGGAIKEGDTVTHKGKILSIEVGEELVGRVVNALGHPIDDRGPIFAENSKKELYPVERQAPGVTEREPVNTPLHTGIKAIDAMIPVGRGQRELIIGDRQTGKTSIAIDTIINQKSDTKFSTPICIYVAIGQKESKVAKIIARLEEAGALDYTIIVSAPASAPASFRYIAPYAATAIAEYFMHQGKDALIVYDDLSKHAVSYREISLLLRRPPGREAYPGDVFYLHSRLLERSARMKKDDNNKQSGGSITALPIIETQLGDISTYIPTNVISITDGQIYLESELFNKGMRPAINPGLSVSRVGGAAQTKAMKRVAGKLRLQLAQYRELAAFSQFASELDDATKKILETGKVLTETLKQSEFAPLPFHYEVVVLFAAINGYFESIPVEAVQTRGTELLAYMHKMHKPLLDTIEKTGELNDETAETLKGALATFTRLQPS
jgi:F-type H+-transporting ATPase subunit alpha